MIGTQRMERVGKPSFSETSCDQTASAVTSWAMYGFLFLITHPTIPLSASRVNPATSFAFAPAADLKRRRLPRSSTISSELASVCNSRLVSSIRAESRRRVSSVEVSR